MIKNGLTDSQRARIAALRYRRDAFIEDAREYKILAERGGIDFMPSISLAVDVAREINRNIVRQLLAWRAA